jgi:hypothetical protein
VILLLESDLVSWSLGMNEHCGHQDLRGSDHRSVIPYVYGRTELYCSNLPCMSLSICPPLRRGTCLSLLYLKVGQLH